jgi:hypothetical protein
MLVCWQRAGGARGFRHAAACAGIALSLTGALLCQYYAARLYLPLAGGGAFRSWKRFTFRSGGHRGWTQQLHCDWSEVSHRRGYQGTT